MLTGDLLAPLPGELRGRVDALVANPPYVPSADIASLPPEVGDFEPLAALDGGADGLAFARGIMVDARGLLAPGGLLAMELDEGRCRAAAEELEHLGYEEVGVRYGPDRTRSDRHSSARQQGRRWAMSKVIHIDQEKPSAEAINLAAAVLRDGGIVVFPTETVYGIGASSASCFGPQEIIDIKARPKNKPLPWLVEDDDALDVYGVDVPEYAHSVARKFWPGAVTIVVKAKDIVAPEFRDDRGTVALRCPDHEVVMELIQASGGPIITTSANTSGKPPAAVSTSSKSGSSPTPT